MRKPSAPLSRHNTRPTRRQGDGTDYTHPALTANGQARVRLVTQVVHSSFCPPIHPQHHQISKPLRTHRSPDQRCNATKTCVSPLPHCRGTTQGRQGDKGMGPTTPNCPTGHPGGKRIRRHHHTVSANNIHPLLPQPVQRNRTAGEFRPDLHRKKSLPEKYFYQALLQIHILYIPDPDSPTGLSPIITPQSSDGSAISNQHAMRVQVLLAMGKYCLFKEEAGRHLDQRFSRFFLEQTIFSHLQEDLYRHRRLI